MSCHRLIGAHTRPHHRLPAGRGDLVAATNTHIFDMAVSLVRSHSNSYVTFPPLSGVVQCLFYYWLILQRALRVHRFGLELGPWGWLGTPEAR